MPKDWRFAAHDPSLVRQLSSALGIAPLTAQVLIARGYKSPESARRFLDAKLSDLYEPGQLPGIPEATDRVIAAVRAGRRITIYGDYDVDGVTATSVLWRCLKLLDAKVDYYIPCRLEEGYGLNAEALRQLHAEDPGRLVVTVDCGIGSLREAGLARELGLELIVTDHHHIAGELPRAACLVHPRLPDSAYPFGDLCGVGVALKLAWSICQKLGDGKRVSPRMREFLTSAVSLAAIGTVADVVPLHGENRVIVRFGLAHLVENSSSGVKSLLHVAGLGENRHLDAEDIAFAIAPRLNAAGRLGQARLAVELLTTESAERAASLAEYLDQLNKNRQTVERRIFKQAKDLAAEHPEWDGHHAVVLAHPEWHPGVIGIVASRVAEHFRKPAVLISFDGKTKLGQGSGRSHGGFDLYSGLAACADCLASYGGHHAAAGLRIDATRVDLFREQLSRFVGENHRADAVAAALAIDAEVRLADVTRRAVLELDRLGPFGSANPRPVFVATRVDLAGPPLKMGEGERHLTLRILQYGCAPLRAVAFGRGEWAEGIAAAGGSISISFAPGINRFRGRENVELQLVDWQPDARPSEPRSHDVGIATRTID